MQFNKKEFAHISPGCSHASLLIPPSTPNGEFAELLNFSQKVRKMGRLEGDLSREVYTVGEVVSYYIALSDSKLSITRISAIR